MQKRFERIRAKCSGKYRDNKRIYSDANDERKCSKSASGDPCKNFHEALEILAQIHPSVEMRYLFFITVEH